MGSLTFVQPRFLLLLLLLAPIWALAIGGWKMRAAARGRRVATWRDWLGLLLRSTILIALVLSLAGAQLVRDDSNLATVFVLDTSDSVSPTARARGEAFIASAIEGMSDDDRAAVVVFGAEAAVERPPTSEKTSARLRLTPDSSATDIGGAMRLGIATLPADTSRRVVLLSDGGETLQAPGASALEVAAAARAEGVPIDVVSLAGGPVADDVAVEVIEAPATAREGQRVRLVVQARLRRAQGAEPVTGWLRVLRDRRPVLETQVELQPGVNRLPLTVEAPRGFHTWEARIDADLDGVGANNVAFGFTDVRGPPRVLLVAGAADRAANLQAALSSARIEAAVIEPEALPATLAGLDVWDAVALVDVPFRRLPPESAALLPAYVRELGRGLLMVGGEDSYAAGGYADTPVEAALPVTMRLRRPEIRPDVALVLVFDRSGSMSGEKLNLAKEGVAQAFTALDATDQVGVVAFDTSAQWIVDLQAKPANDDFLAALGGVGEGGGTDLRPGLEQAAVALERAEARVKHVVLLTDGQAEQNYDDVVDRLKGAGITLSTVGVGDGYDPHLRDIAPATGGRFYEALNFGDIPGLFFDETVRIARRGIVEQTFTPRLSGPLGAAGPSVRGLSESPPLHGYHAVTPRDTAQVALVGPNDDPILAQWQYGLGQAAAWTSDMKGQWARDWVGWTGFGRFAAQLVESLIARPSSSSYEASAAVTGGALALDLRADSSAARGAAQFAGRLIGSDGSVIDVPLAEREPGRYRGTIPLPRAGVYRVQVVATGAYGAANIVASAGAVVPPSAEYLQPEGNPALLRAVAETSGGRQNVPAGEVFLNPSTPARRSAPITWPLLWLAVLLWPIDIAVRRLLLPGTLVRVPALLRRVAPGRLASTAPGGAELPRRAATIARARAGRVDGNSAPGVGTRATEPASTQGPPARATEERSPAPIATAERPNWRTARRSLPERPNERKEERR